MNLRYLNFNDRWILKCVLIFQNLKLNTHLNIKMYYEVMNIK